LFIFTQNGTGASYALLPAPVPEPGTVGLLGAAVVGMMGRRRRIGIARQL
jgi:hypothetical protein